MRILVKAKPGLPVAQLTFGAAAVPFAATPLFRSIGPPPGLGAAAGDVWQILTPAAALEGENSWDICHSLLRQGFGVAGAGAPAFAEPDLEQQWITGNDSEVGMALAKSCDKVDAQSADFPRDKIPTGFAIRRIRSSMPPSRRSADRRSAAKVRIAHFDTGYDPQHHTLPKRLRKDLARNFVDDGNPNDASDQTSGIAHQSRSRHRHAQHPGRQRASRDSRCSAARRSPKSCRFGSPTASCCSTTARSPRRSIMCMG